MKTFTIPKVNYSPPTIWHDISFIFLWQITIFFFNFISNQTLYLSLWSFRILGSVNRTIPTQLWILGKLQCIGIKRDMSCHNKSIFHYFLEGYVFFWLNNRQKFTLLFYKREWLSIIWNKVTIGQGLCCGAIRIIVFCLLKLYLMKIPSHRIHSSLAMCYSDH